MINYVLTSGGIEYADKKMRDYASKAIAEIQSLPDNEARNSLIQLVQFTIDREK